KLDRTFWHSALMKLIDQPHLCGEITLGDGEPVNVEYVSANPTGPLHIGHARGTVIGEVIANLLDICDYDVTREYLINDSGGQINVLAKSVYLRYREALGESVGEIPEGLYPGEYLKSIGQALADEFGPQWLDKPEDDWLNVFKEHAVNHLMQAIKHDLNLLGIRHDVFFSEKSLDDEGKVDQVIDKLENLGLLYQGKLPKPKSRNVEEQEYEAQELLLFRATDFGDEVDRAMRKVNDDHTYLAADFAYHFDKYQRLSEQGGRRMINIFGADHSGQVTPLKAGVQAITEGKAELTVILCQMVRFVQGGQPAKMSKRAGTYETINDLIEAVGKDVVFFIFATKDPNTQFTFDLELLTKQSMDNPVFYVQYAHARATSVLNKAVEENITIDGIDEKLLASLTAPEELALIKKLTVYPDTVKNAASKLAPHVLTDYLYNVANLFHSLWGSGHRDPAMRFIQDDAKVSRAKLALVKATKRVLSDGLQLCNVTPMDEMTRLDEDEFAQSA
ncbi:MAG: arginine--tRNA ligase, partial [Gammaproteobacteria bacterium]|nr:arginine--tRNA ligase [Gammaproteobacteria bacterium]